MLDIRLPSPPSSSSSSSTDSNAGPDVEAQLIRAIQGFLAAAGRRPLAVSIEPSERVVVQIVCHVHSAV